MASSTKLEAVYVVTTHVPCGSICYIVVLKVHVWCTKVLWGCGMQAEYMCICSIISGAGISIDSAPALQAF